PYRAGKIDELLQAGLDVVCLYPRALAGIERLITLLGRFAGTADAAASITAALRAELAMAPVAAGQRVYVEMWPNPLRTAETWVKEIVEALGADFVPAAPNVQLTGEQIIDAAPDVIVLARAGVAEIDPDPVYARPGGQQIPAVRDGRVLPVNEIMLNAPGPNLVEGIRELRQVLRGE
ncbi:MAG: ABC transporter substrate-binding protein, partial [Anaerolineae bacterium]